ncbi:protein O-mannosyl-transferase TMTC1-like [Cydia pomonella]|uniref:protein O-mannosyl-transferase TMTC1-like n=1 Tax=Cydia pomonella TaxID=82600 RepID=UPI002ADDB2DF|nr:protein O-mannosyl-transferase TMTC1-like [Cydia pomonella]
MRRRHLPPVREEPKKIICNNDWIIYTLVASIAAITYSNSLNGDFVHDDIPAIVTNGDVTGVNTVVTVFKNDFWGTPMSDPGSHKSYRPLTTLTFRLNYFFSGLSPWYWHVTNAFLHCVSCTLVARASATIARLRRPFAALAGLLFALHPVHSEAVAGVVGRADVLASIFFLSSILMYHGCSNRYRACWSVVLAALSMLAKETGLTALLVNIVLDLYKSWPGARCSLMVKWRWKGDACARISIALAGLVLLATARVALLQGSLPAFSPQDNPPAFHPSFLVRLMTFCYLAAFNWWLLLCPWTLSHDWQMGSVPLVTSGWDPRNLLTVAALIVLIALSYKCWIDLELQRHPPAAVGLMLLVIPYLPASNLLVTVGFVVAERVLYLPSVGSVILTAYGIQLLWRRSDRRLLLVGAAILAASFAARTIMRNQDWRTRETLLRADLAVLPHNAKLHYNFANFLKDKEQQENAIKHYKEALKLWPSYASAHNNLGTLVIASGRAEHHFLQALKYNRDHVNAHYNLAKLYRKKNRLADALKMIERCLALEPRFVQAYIELLQLKNEDQKRGILDKLLELEPRNWEHYVLYGDWFKGRGLLPISLNYYMTALKLSLASGDRRGVAALRAACLVLRQKGQWARALHLIIRWQTMRGDARAAGARALWARAWRLRRELQGRAALYARPRTDPEQPKSTCLDYSQLELRDPAEKHNKKAQSNTLLSETKNNAKDKSCQNESAKKVSILTQFKPIHNKSETGKSCSLRKKEIKDADLTPFVSDHLIKTY